MSGMTSGIGTRSEAPENGTMKAMLLTAGYGERLRPLTEQLPKPAIPVLGRPIAEQLLRWLAHGNPEHVVLNLHHLPHVLRKLLSEDAPGLPPVRFSHEPEILGTGGGLRYAAPMLKGSGPIVVGNGDALWDIDLHVLLEAHRASGMLATLVVAPHRPGYSVVEVDERGRVLSLAGEPAADPRRVADRTLFTGCHVIDEAVLDRIPAEGPSDIVRDVYRDLAAEGRLGAYLHDGFWWEFGSPELYLEGSLALLDLGTELRQRVTEHDPIRRVDRAIGAIGPGAKYDPQARFLRRVALGFASHVSAGSMLEDTLVLPEAWIGPRCKLKRVIVGPGAELPADFEVSNALVCTATAVQSDIGREIRRVNGLIVCPLRT